MRVSDSAAMETFVGRIRELGQSAPWVRGAMQHGETGVSPKVKQKRGGRVIRRCSVALAMTLGAILCLAGVAGADPTQIDTSKVLSDVYTDTTSSPVALGADAGLDRYLLYYYAQNGGAGSEWVVDEKSGTATDIAESNYLTESHTDATYEQGLGAMSSDGNKIAWETTANNGDGLGVAADNNGTWVNESLPGPLLDGGTDNHLVTAIAFSADGNLMAVTGEIEPTGTTTWEASGVYLYDFDKGTVQQVTTQVQSGVIPISLAFSGDGSRLLVAQGGDCAEDGPLYTSADGTVVVDSINSSDVVSPLWSSTSGNYGYTGCAGAALSGDGSTVAFSGDTGAPAVVVGDLANSTEHLIDEPVSGPAAGFELSQNGSIVYYEAAAHGFPGINAVYSSSTAIGSVGTDVSDPADLETCDLVSVASTGLESAFNCIDDALDFEGVFVASGSVASGSGAGGGPAFPSGAALQASSVTTSSVTLSWPAAFGPNGVSGYTLTENGTAIAPPSAKATSIQVTGLAPGTAYHFRLTAGDSDGNVSSPLSVDVTTATPPLPSNITPAPVSDGALATAAASLTSATVSAYLAKIGVSCAGGKDTSCHLAIKLALTETLKGGKVVAITARSKQKTKKRTVALGTTTVTVAGGSHKTVSVKLNSAARKLLRRYHHLKVALTATNATTKRVLVKRVLTFTQPTHG
jgi:chitodextrinase